MDSDMKPATLTSLRTRAGLSQAALADKLGVSRQTINRWENGLTPISRIKIPAIEAACLPAGEAS